MNRPALRVQLLGGFHLTLDDAPVVGGYTARLQSILAYLILHADTPQSRQHLAFLLWPDTLESRARNNLRQYLHQLRQLLPNADRFLVSNAHTVHWQSDDQQTIDAQLFVKALQAADEMERSGDVNRFRHTLERALAHYHGDLLPACYDEWIAPVRERLHQQCHHAAERLLHLLETGREYAAAIQLAEQMLQLDPLNEITYAALMRLYALNEDRTGVQRVYRRAVATIQRELGVEVSETLRITFERLHHAPRALFLPATVNASTSATQLIGRKAEWMALQASWQRTTRCNAHLTLITGEAGIGKSRLAEELFKWVAQQGFGGVCTRSYDGEGVLSLAPVTEWLRNDLLRANLGALDNLWLTELARLLPELLDEVDGLVRPEPITEYGRRQRFFEALARAALATPGPLLLWIDDLQWCDQETLEWLHFLLRFAPDSALLILATARSEELHPTHPVTQLMRQLQTENRVEQIELAPLDAAETAQLAAQVYGRAMPDTAVNGLYRETEGNPLFVVETVRAAMTGVRAAEGDEIGASLSDLHVLPPRVQAIIGGRLAQLSPEARKVVEIGAAVGRAFPFDLLLRTGCVAEETAVQALDELWQRRIVREQAANLFDFTHDKLREVAYGEISAPQRRFLHRRIAQALETCHAENLDPVSAQLAVQYEKAGLFDQAIPYFQRAGSLAADVYANADAIRLYTRGLALLAQVAPGHKRDAQELAFQFGLATLFSITKGWAAPEVEAALTRALVLGDKVGDVTQRVKIRRGLQALYVVRAQYDLVRQFYEEAEQLVRTETRRYCLPDVRNYAIGLLFMGHAPQSHSVFEQFVANHNQQSLAEFYDAYGLDPLASTYAMRSQTLWYLGDPAAAHESLCFAEQRARQHNKPVDQAVTMAYRAMLQEWVADFDAFQSQAEASFALCREHQVNYYYVWSAILLHFASAWQQPNAKNLTQLGAAINELRATGAGVRLPYYFSLLARVHLKAEKFDNAQTALQQGAAVAQQNNEHWWDAELYRLRGAVQQAQGANHDAVETLYCQAIKIAQTQQAKSLELRAALSLARWWQHSGRPVAAKQLLVPIYGWFRDGFDTVDLQSARALIAQL